MVEVDPLQAHLAAVAENLEAISYIKNALALDEYSTAYEAWAELSDETKHALWRAPSKGGKAFTTAEIAKMKSDEWGAARKYHHGEAA